ncbi:MAG: pyridoxamine 5'-phosphate oxidase family protein [Desulfobacterales bacterium]|nr:pyridoxamine 5'-phosphate oxidase family protein [Desulfobacterales bacterium]
MEQYHSRRPEKMINELSEMIDLIKSHKIMSLAMCKDNQPYLVTVNYGFDEKNQCYYFHSAQVGKKIDYLKSNPVVWGQILEDGGYIQGQCDHAYKTVQFKGKVEFLTDIDEIKDALYLMIDCLEDVPEQIKGKFSNPNSFKKVAICKVTMLGISGKQSGI